MCIRVMQDGFNIGNAYHDYAGKALKLKLISGVIIVRFPHVGGCQGHAAQVDIMVMQDGLI